MTRSEIDKKKSEILNIAMFSGSIAYETFKDICGDLILQMTILGHTEMVINLDKVDLNKTIEAINILTS